MAINLGTNTNTKFYIGNNLVPRIYLGTTKVYEAPYKTIYNAIQTYDPDTGGYISTTYSGNNYYQPSNISVAYSYNDIELIKATFYVDINDLTKCTVVECIVNGVANDTISGLEIPFGTRSISYDYNTADGTASRFNLGFIDLTVTGNDDATVCIAINTPANS